MKLNLTRQLISRLQSRLKQFALMAVLASLVSPAIAQSLQIGVLTKEPPEVIQKRYSQLTQHLKAQGWELDAMQVGVDPIGFAQAFQKGQLNVIFAEMTHGLLLMDGFNASPLLLYSESQQVADAAQFFVHKDSKINSLEDFKGKVLVFDSKDSLLTYHLPRELLNNTGLKLRYSRKPVPGAVAYYFSGDESAAVKSVAFGGQSHIGVMRKTRLSHNRAVRPLPFQTDMMPSQMLLVSDALVDSSLRDDLLSFNLQNPQALPVFRAFPTRPVSYIDDSIRPHVQTVPHDAPMMVYE